MTKKATLQEAAVRVTGNPKATLQDMADTIVKGWQPGSGSGDAAVQSVNGETGAVVLDGNDINATLTGAGDPVTASLTEHLQTLKNDEAELGNQVSGIQSLVPSDASEQNLLATKADITRGITVTDNANGTKIIRMGKTVIITGTDSVGSVGASVATEHPIVLPVTMANNTYVVSLTPTCTGGFAQLNVDYEEETTTGFNVGLRNIGSTGSSDVKIGWIVIGEIAE